MSLTKLKEMIGQKQVEVSNLEAEAQATRQRLHREIQTRSCPVCGTGSFVVNNLPSPGYSSVGDLATCDNQDCRAKFSIRTAYLGGPGEDEVLKVGNYKFHVAHRGYEWETWPSSECTNARLKDRIRRKALAPYTQGGLQQSFLDILELQKRHEDAHADVKD